ncbi:MAG: hypothetical protein OHK0011_09160 [Turneriella sp.]
MRKILLLLLLTSPLLAADTEAAVESLIEKLSRRYRETKDLVLRKNLAVARFEALTPAVAEAGYERTVRELMITRLNNSAVFVLLERENLDKILQEQALQLSGATTDKDSVALGKLLNAHAILTGSVGEMGDDVRITVKLTDVETGRVFAEEALVARESLMATRERLADMAYLQQYGVGISLSLLATTVGGEQPGLMTPDTTWISRVMGAELRYRFTRNFTMGAGLAMAIGSFKKFPSYPYVLQPNNSMATVYSGGSLSIETEGTPGIAPALNFYGVLPLSRRFNLFAMTGLEFMLLTNTTARMEPKGALPAGAEIDHRYRDYDYRFKTEVVALHLGGGAEYYFTPRLAASLRLAYSFVQADIRTQPQNLRVSMSGFSFYPAVTLYF